MRPMDQLPHIRKEIANQANAEIQDQSIRELEMKIHLFPCTLLHSFLKPMSAYPRLYITKIVT